MKENDCISRKQAIERLKLNFPISQGADDSRDRHRYMQAMADIQAIREMPSVAPQEPRWIPVKLRPLTDEEQNEYPDYCYMADCPMPDAGEEILVCTVHGTVEKDECGIDDGFFLDSGYDWQTDIVAWMPLPQPYREGEK